MLEMLLLGCLLFPVILKEGRFTRAVKINKLSFLPILFLHLGSALQKNVCCVAGI